MIPAPALAVSGLRAGYGRSDDVVRGIDLDLPAGMIMGVVGPSGSGKSTFVKTLAGLLPARHGTISVTGSDVTALSAAQRVGTGLAYVPQESNIFASLTIRENLKLATEYLHGRPGAPKLHEHNIARPTWSRISCFALKLMERAPERVVAGVLVQTVGHHPEHPDYMYNAGRDVWAPELLRRRPELSMGRLERYLHDLYRARPEFVYSVSRDFARSCATPILVLPDETPAHPHVSSVEVASLCPNAEITVFPWREPPELKTRTIERVRKFLMAHRR